MEDEEGRTCGNPQLVNNSEEARDVLDKLWNRAMSLSGEAVQSTERNTLAEQLGDLIGSVPDLPADMAEQHDHHLHGAPKR